MHTRVNLFGKLLRISHLVGIMPKDEYQKPGARCIRILYTVYQLWPLVFMIPQLLSQLAALYHYWGDTVLVLDIIGMLDAVTIGFFVNVWGFLVCKRFDKLLVHLETDSVFTSRLVHQNFKVKQILETGRRRCFIFSGIIGCSICLAILFLATSPVFIGFIKSEEQSSCQKEENSTLTPMEMYQLEGYDQFSIPMWLPVNSTRWYYEIWFVHFMVYLGACRAMAPYSSMMIGMFVAAGMQFEIIAELVETLKDESSHNAFKTTDLNVSGVLPHKRVSAKAYLKDIIRLHQKALESSIEMNALQTQVVSACLVLTVVLIVTSMFQLTVDPTLTVKYALVLTALLFHVFIYAHVGERISEQSERIGHAAYESNWYEEDTEFKHLVHIMMIRCQKPSVWTVLKQIEIKLVTFVDIISVCYRILMVLIQLEDLQKDTCLQLQY